jgi:hypothetical protein
VVREKEIAIEGMMNSSKSRRLLQLVMFHALSHRRGGIWGEIGISSTVGFDLVQASVAAFLMASRFSSRAASQP